MARKEVWVNNDGLKVGFGARDTNNYEAGTVRTVGKVNQLEILLDWDNLPSLGAVDNDNVGIPANAVIQSATLVVEDAFESAGATTLGIGLQTAAGVAIDADGIDAAIAKTAIDADGDVVQCDGALVGGVTTIGGVEGYIYTVVGTGPYTAGRAVLTVEYILP